MFFNYFSFILKWIQSIIVILFQSVVVENMQFLLLIKIIFKFTIRYIMYHFLISDKGYFKCIYKLHITISLIGRLHIIILLLNIILFSLYYFSNILTYLINNVFS